MLFVVANYYNTKYLFDMFVYCKNILIHYITQIIIICDFTFHLFQLVFQGNLPISLQKTQSLHQTDLEPFEIRFFGRKISEKKDPNKRGNTKMMKANND